MRKIIVIVSLFLLAAAAALFWQSGVLTATSSIFSKWRESGALLLEERTAKEQALAEAKALRQENEFLRAAAGLAAASSSRVLLARVLATRPIFLRHTLIVDQGAAEGVEPGSAAFGLPRQYVGVVREVRERTSLVETFFHPDSRIAVQTISGKVKGVLEGRFGSGAIFWGFAPEGELKENEELYGSEASVAAGFLLGKTGRVEYDPSQGKFTAAVQPIEDGLPGFVFLFRP